MFEEAENWIKENMDCVKTDGSFNQDSSYFSDEEKSIAKSAFKDGANLGYSKINEWHFVKDGDLPKDGRIVSDQNGNNVKYVKHRKMWFYRYRSCEADVIAWCETPKYTEK